MRCCCVFLSSCCCTEAGLRCHSIISLCGTLYFAFMFLLFGSQEKYFEFRIPEPDNTKVALIVAAGIWLVLFLISTFMLFKKTKNQEPKRAKNKLTIADIKDMRQENNYHKLSEEETPNS